jgi:hypothetical protein
VWRERATTVGPTSPCVTKYNEGLPQAKRLAECGNGRIGATYPHRRCRHEAGDLAVGGKCERASRVSETCRLVVAIDSPQWYVCYQELNWEEAAMRVKFDLGRVIIGQDAALALEVSGQEADFFLCKHARGDGGEENPSANDFYVVVKSKYRTLKGQILEVVTFVREQKTYVDTLPRSIDSNSYVYDTDYGVGETATDILTTTESPDPHTPTTSIDINNGLIYDADGPIGPTFDTSTTLESPADSDTDLPMSD